MVKEKMDKKLKKQIDASFEIIEKLQPITAKGIKDGFIKALSQTMDITKESPLILTGVGSLNDIDGDFSDLNEWNTFDDWFLEHKKHCKVCNYPSESNGCKEYQETLEYHENSYSIYTNGEFKEIENEITIINDTLTVKCNYEVNTFQVLKSEVIVKRGFASLCYPGQCELNTKGDISCYDLPKDYYLEEK